jgi:hypothetical protein
MKFLSTLGSIVAPQVSQATDQLATAFEVLIGEGALVIILLSALLFLTVKNQK